MTLRPSFVIINIMFAALLAAAWAGGLLAPFLNAPLIETTLLGCLAVVFFVGQACIAIGELESADMLAQSLPKIGLCAFGLTIVALGYTADLSNAAGKAAFARSVIESIGLNIAAIFGMVWNETLVWWMRG